MTFWRRPSKDEVILVNAHDLDQIGFRNELLRNQIVEIENGLRQVDSFKESFRGIVMPIAGALEELETTRSELEETQAKLSVAAASLAELHAQHFAQSSDLEAAKSEIEVLSQDRADLDRRLKFAQFALDERNSVAEQRGNDLESTRAQVQAQSRANEELASELQVVKAELDEKYRDVAKFEQAHAVASDQNRLLQQKVDSLGRSNEGYIDQITKHRRRESDLESDIEHARGQIDELKSALAQVEVAQGMARLQHEEAMDRLAADYASTRGQLEASEDRASTIERLLDEARQQLGLKVGEARGLELKLHEQTMRAVAAERKLGSLQEDLAEVDTRLAQSDMARQALVERSKTLVNSMEAKSAALDKAESRVQYLNGRLEDLAQSLQDLRNQSEQQILHLTQELEKQRAERVFAEGALQASRRARLSVTAEIVSETRRRDPDGDRPALADARPIIESPSRERPADRDTTPVKVAEIRVKPS